MKLIKKAKLTEAKVDEEDRKMALAQFLGLTDEDIDELVEDRHDETRFEYGREEYLVLTEYEADNVFKDSQEQLIDEIGLGAFSNNFKDYIVNNLVDEDAFWRDTRSDIEEWIYEEPSSYESYFDEDEVKDEIRKLVKKGKIKADDIESGFDEDDYEDKKEFEDAVEDAIDSLYLEDALNIWKDSGQMDVSDAADAYIKDQGSPYDFLENLYGRDDETIFKQLESYIDTNKVIEEIQDSDGRGPTIAGYDGEENEAKVNGTWFFIYRTN